MCYRNLFIISVEQLDVLRSMDMKYANKDRLKVRFALKSLISQHFVGGLWDFVCVCVCDSFEYGSQDACATQSMKKARGKKVHMKKKRPMDKKTPLISNMLSLNIQRIEEEKSQEQNSIYEISKNDPLLYAS